MILTIHLRSLLVRRIRLLILFKVGMPPRLIGLKVHTISINLQRFDLAILMNQPDRAGSSPVVVVAAGLPDIPGPAASTAVAVRVHR